VQEAVNRTRAAALGGFPDLSAVPPDAESARGLIRETLAWADSLNVAKGWTGVDSNDGSLLAGVDIHASGPAAHWSVSQLLGSFPKHLCDPVDRSAFACWLDRQHKHDPVSPEAREHPERHWGDITDNLRWAYLSERAKALQLCGWVEAQLKAFTDALLPVIEIGPVIKQRRRKVRVHIGGAEVGPDDVTSGQADFLLSIADGASNQYSRPMMTALQKNVGVLKNLIHTTGERASNGDGYAVYVLDACMVGRIRNGLAPEDAAPPTDS
jgi:hypothetical protein